MRGIARAIPKLNIVQSYQCIITQFTISANGVVNHAIQKQTRRR